MSSIKLQGVLFLGLCSIGFACGSGLLIKTKCRSYWYSSELKTWAEAKAYCSARGNHLVIPLDYTEAKNIMTAIFTNGGSSGIYWMGLHSTSSALTAWEEAVCNDQLSASWNYGHSPGKCAKSYYGALMADSCDAKHPVVCGLEAEGADGACVHPYTSTFNSNTYTTVWRETTRENAKNYCSKVLGASLFNMASPAEMWGACAPLIAAGVANQPFWSEPQGPNSDGQFTTCGNIPMTPAVQLGLFENDGQNPPGSNNQCIALVNDVYKIKNCDECHKFICESPAECTTG